MASEGGTVRIKCEITGYPLPRYVWYRNDVAVDASADDSTRQTRVNIKTTPWGSRSSTSLNISLKTIASDTAVFVMKRDVKLQPTNSHLSKRR